MADTNEIDDDFKKHKPHPIWETMPYMHGLLWTNKINKNKKNGARKRYIEGVEIRQLGEEHILKGEYGLFASKKFRQCDIVGEYVGVVVDTDVSGEYVAALENRDWSLGVDAGKGGNEIRFINCFMGIRDKPNVRMQRVFIDTYPHIMIVCLEDIEVGDEFLLDYGESYINEFLIKKEPVVPKVVEEKDFNVTMFSDELPGFGNDKDSDCEEGDDEVAVTKQERLEKAERIIKSQKLKEVVLSVDKVEASLAAVDLHEGAVSDAETETTASISDGIASETSEE